MHDEVDALDDGGWWEGRVTQVGKQRYKVQPFISSSLLTVKKADVRNGVVWDGQGWSQRQSAGQLFYSIVRTRAGHAPGRTQGHLWHMHCFRLVEKRFV